MPQVGNDTVCHAALHSLVTENIEQGKYFYSHSSDAAYRENTMTANFIRAFDALSGESVMGIYGAARIGLEGAYALFAEQPKIGGVLPYDNYPMPVEAGQVFVIDLTKTDGSVERRYFRSDDGDMDGDGLTTVEFTIA